MKKILSFTFFSIVSIAGMSQTNTFPTTGNVGIGTTNPEAKLHVKNGALMASDVTFSSINLRLDGSSIPTIKFTRWTGSSSHQHNAFVGQFFNSALGEYSLGIGTGVSYTGDQNATSNIITIPLNGNVGIGTTTPAARLHIADGGFRHGGTGEINIDAPGVIGGRLKIYDNGNVGIGTTTPDYKLTVNGKIKAEEMQVVVDVPADYVFEKDYSLMPLIEVEKFVTENKHLPGMPDAQSLINNGWQVGEMNNKMLEKVEELTLYIIDMKKEIDQMKKENEELKKLIKKNKS